MTTKKKLVDLYQHKGFLFPTTAQEVEAFEKLNTENASKPMDWDAPEAILKRGVQKLQGLKAINDEGLGKEIEELKMVARKGNNLPQHIIDKMKANHKKDDK
ncbi:MAG: hypothetical protein ACT6QS_01135 [Flavobacteriales bacterium]